MRILFHSFIFSVAAVLMAAATASAAQPSAQSILENRCGACHEKFADGYARIKDIRKTPEGWDMSILRMKQWHGVEIPPGERAILVKYLSDTQGLAPAETAPWRYIFERTPNVVEDKTNRKRYEMCGRCHSLARPSVQRRDEDEWRKLANTHLGQFVTAEYQALARDREWWRIARDEMPVELAKAFPFNTPEWTAWKAHKKADLSGSWAVSGERPGTGRYAGTAQIKRTGPDRYTISYALTYADGQSLVGISEANVFTGYEWRGTGRLGDENINEVYALSEDGQTLTGRWFLSNADEIGGRFTARRIGAGALVSAVEPPYLRAGENTTVRIYGANLGAGAVSLGKGVKVKIVKRSDTLVVVRAKAGKRALGRHAVSVGAARADVVVYDKIDHLRVEPPFAIARLGGGALHPVTAQFDAVAYLNGPDGAANTDDDIRLGAMPATWSVANFDATAEKLKDTEFAGRMQPNGLFVPALAGPNPARPFHTNNAGNMKVTAEVRDGKQTLHGEGQLIVTVQRWNEPPLR
jgi:quinohemoprotein amine dehydrogenase